MNGFKDLIRLICLVYTFLDKQMILAPFYIFILTVVFFL